MKTALLQHCRAILGGLKHGLRASQGLLSPLLILAGLAALIGFAATFGQRWALLAAGPVLILLGMAVGS